MKLLNPKGTGIFLTLYVPARFVMEIHECYIKNTQIHEYYLPAKSSSMSPLTCCHCLSDPPSFSEVFNLNDFELNSKLASI